MFGLEDILNARKYRTMTVECQSMNGVCHFITKESFIHCVNQFKFSQSVIEEQIVRHQRYIDRFSATYVFQDEFIKNQRQMLNKLITIQNMQPMPNDISNVKSPARANNEEFCPQSPNTKHKNQVMVMDASHQDEYNCDSPQFANKHRNSTISYKQFHA